MNDRSRPVKAAPEVIAATTSSVGHRDDIPAQLRRRRAASRRLPELPDGRRDTLDKPRPRRPVTVRVLGANTTEIGDGAGVLAVLRRVGCRRMRARDGRGWWIPGRDTEAVLEALEGAGYRIEATL